MAVRAQIEGVPDQRISTNTVASSNNCDVSCFPTLRDTLDTTRPLTVSFDRYVDAKAGSGEGPHVEYSADSGTTRSCMLTRRKGNPNVPDVPPKALKGASYGSPRASEPDLSGISSVSRLVREACCL